MKLPQTRKITPFNYNSNYLGITTLRNDHKPFKDRLSMKYHLHWSLKQIESFDYDLIS